MFKSRLPDWGKATQSLTSQLFLAAFNLKLTTTESTQPFKMVAQKVGQKQALNPRLIGQLDPPQLVLPGNPVIVPTQAGCGGTNLAGTDQGDKQHKSASWEGPGLENQEQSLTLQDTKPAVYLTRFWLTPSTPSSCQFLRHCLQQTHISQRQPRWIWFLWVSTQLLLGRSLRFKFSVPWAQLAA